MQPFRSHQGIVAVLDRNNVDTDAILPKQFMKSIKRSGFGDFAFDEWRYLDVGELDMDCSLRPLNPDFELNQPRYQGASFLLSRRNFGCGSSREHAPWALLEYGFRVIVAETFAEIFYDNCLKNGILPIALSTPLIEWLQAEILYNIGYTMVVDLEKQTLVLPGGEEIAFDIDKHRKRMLIHGWDSIDLTLQSAPKIERYEQRHQQLYPWLYW